ncbi:MAG: dihydropteroate synthase [Bacteroidia bacterium]|nr:dihydropteroate synthase [Bacteroidia bacterium]
MGILNLTPDSFSDGGKFTRPDQALAQTECMLREGASIIDIGGYSTRPYAPEITPEEELRRVEKITGLILEKFPEAILSIDSFRTEVVRPLLDMGVHIVNDIFADQASGEMMRTVARYKNVPYIMMHMQGTPQTMQQAPQYKSVTTEVLQFFVEQIYEARQKGIEDIVIDPGFGFGKTLLNNYQLLEGLHHFNLLNRPVLVGISRKSMIYKFFETDPGDVLEITTALHLKALEKGALILRVHDVKAAARIVQLYGYLKENGII